jgi:hypothetical protein
MAHWHLIVKEEHRACSIDHLFISTSDFHFLQEIEMHLTYCTNNEREKIIKRLWGAMFLKAQILIKFLYDIFFKLNYFSSLLLLYRWEGITGEWKVTLWKGFRCIFAYFICVPSEELNICTHFRTAAISVTFNWRRPLEFCAVDGRIVTEAKALI